MLSLEYNDFYFVMKILRDKRKLLIDLCSFNLHSGFGRRLDTELKTIENEVVKVLNTLQTLPEGDHRAVLIPFFL